MTSGIGHWTNQEFGLFRNPDTRQSIPDPENYKRMFINPLDNTRNLSQEYLQSLQNAPESYRRRFFLGQYTAETDGALWSYERLEQIRVRKADLPVMSRIVVAVDLSGCRGPEETRSDEIGIVVA